MPVHDWTRVRSGLFHEFHQSWSVRIKDALNRSGMPKGYYALVEQKVDGPEPDVIAVATMGGSGGVATMAPPRTKLQSRLTIEASQYARRANRISIRHPLGNVVAVIEIVSPGNKDSRRAINAFVMKAVAFLQNGVHLLIVDLFPPSIRDPFGIHPLIWSELSGMTDAWLDEPSRMMVSYQCADEITAHMEPIELSSPLPSMPLFLTADFHVPVDLESSYRETWDVCPEPIREMILAGSS